MASVHHFDSNCAAVNLFVLFGLLCLLDIYNKMPCCVAVNCSNRAENGIRLFRFPRDKTRCAMWVAKVKRDNWKPTQSSYLCEVCLSFDFCYDCVLYPCIQ